MSRPRVLVLGDPLLDRWMHGTANKLCREAPVPAIDVDHVDEACGGAANTAINLAALGADTVFVGPVGPDSAARRLRDRLRAGGVYDILLPVTGRRTVTKTRVVVNGRIVGRIDEGSNGSVPTDDGRRLADRLRTCLRGVDALVVGDYAGGAVDDGLLGWLLNRRRWLPMVVVDAHEPLRWRGLRPSLLTSSFDELAPLWTRTMPDCPATVLANAEAVRAGTKAELTAVTLDVDGSLVIGAEGLRHRTRAKPVPPQHTAGAGDVYTAAFTVALLSGQDPPAAADRAQQAATVATRRPGTCVCQLADLEPLGADRPTDPQITANSTPRSHAR